MTYATERRTQIAVVIAQLDMEPPNMHGWQYVEIGEFQKFADGRKEDSISVWRRATSGAMTPHPPSTTLRQLPLPAHTTAVRRRLATDEQAELVCPCL